MWDQPQQTKIYGPVKAYLIEITPNLNLTRIYKTSINNYTFQNLQPCQNYCFILKSVNGAGHSSKSEALCANTNACKVLQYSFKLTKFVKILVKQFCMKLNLISQHLDQSGGDMIQQMDVLQHSQFDIINAI